MLIAHILGVIGLIFLLISLQINNKSKILLSRVISNVFTCSQYFLLGAFSAGFMSCISLIRCSVFYYYEDKKKKMTPTYLFVILLIVPVIISFFTFSDIFSIFPIICTVAYTYSMWQKNLTQYRVIAVVCSVLWITYNLHVGVYASLVGNVLELINAVIAIFRFDIKKKDKE